MLKALFSGLATKLNPYAWAIKIGIALWVGIYILMLQLKLFGLKVDIKEAQNDLERQILITQKWQQAHTYMAKQVRDQNQAIEALAIAEKQAKARALQAVKKARARVEYRRAQINAAQNRANTASTCEQAVDQVKNELKAGML
jgi:flagellar biosynthesis protein FliP